MIDGWMMMMNMGKLIGWLFSRQSVGICCLRKKTDGSFFFKHRAQRTRSLTYFSLLASFVETTVSFVGNTYLLLLSISCPFSKGC